MHDRPGPEAKPAVAANNGLTDGSVVEVRVLDPYFDS